MGKRLPVCLCGLLLVLSVGFANAADDSVLLVSDFESGKAMDSVRCASAPVTRVALPDGGHALCWDLPNDESTCGLSIGGTPRDVTGCRYLELRVRSEGVARDEVQVRLRSGDAVLTHPLCELGAVWREARIPLPEMKELGGRFDPQAVDEVRVVVFGAKGSRVLLDDIRLVPAPGGWRWTLAERAERVFGEKRAREVRTIETEHFVLFTDSSAAGRKFPRALETIHAYVLEELGLAAPPGRIPAYVFQNRRLYHDFCVRHGFSRDHAASTAGHASAEYFSTYYQSPRAPVLVHEMTHSIFQRARGGGGGSWFQEGVAVFVENRWQKRSPALSFASRLRSGHFMPLRDFIACEKLIAMNDQRGGARTGAAAYAQAGAFFEFLVRGPPAEEVPDAIGKLAEVRAAGANRVAAVEKILGRSVEEIERAWVKWGSRPPKPKRK
jgi:hypothetical protein